MKITVSGLKDARIEILRARRNLELIEGREISVFELGEADKYLERVIDRLDKDKPDLPMPESVKKIINDFA